MGKRAPQRFADTGSTVDDFTDVFDVGVNRIVEHVRRQPFGQLAADPVLVGHAPHVRLEGDVVGCVTELAELDDELAPRRAFGAT